MNQEPELCDCPDNSFHAEALANVEPTVTKDAGTVTKDYGSFSISEPRDDICPWGHSPIRIIDSRAVCTVCHRQFSTR